MAVGAAGVARAIVGLTKPDWAPIHVDALTPVALGVGTALLMVGFWMLAGTRAPDAPRAFAAAERGSLIVATGAIVVALFWVTDMFATFRGQDLARNINAGLWSRENVVVLDVDASQDLPLLLKNQIEVDRAPLGSWTRQRSRRFFATSVSVSWPFTMTAGCWCRPDGLRATDSP